MCHYSIIANYKCLSEMEPLEDNNERSIVFGRPRGIQESMDYGRLLRSPRGKEDRTKVSHEAD